MIDTNKLLSNRSGGSTTLSKKSVVNIGLIREDVIKIDGMLKSRLVLSKVREGIERQNQERLRRKSREEELERDDNQDDDPDRRQRKTKLIFYKTKKNPIVPTKILMSTKVGENIVHDDGK